MLLFGRRAFVLDVKGEYAPLCDAAGVTPVQLAPGNGVCLNPLSARRDHARAGRAAARRRAHRDRPPALHAEEAGVLREALIELQHRDSDA